MRTFNFNLAMFTANFVAQLLNEARAQSLEPAAITVLAPDPSFLFDIAEDGSFVYTDVTPKGVAIDGQTTYAALAVGAAEYTTIDPLLRKIAFATTTFTWSVGIVADASQAEYVVFETGGAQILDLQCTYSSDASGGCSDVQQGGGNFIGAITGRPRLATFTPILTVSAPTPTPAPLVPTASANSLPQGSAGGGENTIASTAITESTSNQLTSTNALLQPSNSSTSTMSTTKSSVATNQNVAGSYGCIVFLSTVSIWLLEHSL